MRLNPKLNLKLIAFLGLCYAITSLVVAMALVSLPGCSTGGTVGQAMYGESGPATAEEKAQAAINEARVLASAVADTASEHVKKGLLTPDEALAIAKELRGALAKANAAQELLDSGQSYASFDQASLSKALIRALERRMVKAAAERSKK